ncbi:MAG: hypothetical protein GWP19_05070 [Planctomycetia bacterium]|nr:hypothetical protein [Planctomycetia bacterium]
MSISGYMTVFRGEEFQFPYKEGIKSLLGCCDEVIVFVTLKDNIDLDNTLANLKVMSEHDKRIKIFTQIWEKDNPLQDGESKAKARSYCNGDWLIQLDADEILHPKDFDFFINVPNIYQDKTLVGVGCLDFFNTRNQIIVDGVANYKPRISKNVSWLTHGLQTKFSEEHPITKKIICPSMLSDGAGYIDTRTGESFNADLWLIDFDIELLRKKSLDEHQINLTPYTELIENTFNKLPYVFHYSCIDLNRKVALQYRIWDALWNLFNGVNIDITEIDFCPGNLRREKVMHRLNNTITAWVDVQHPNMALEYLAKIGK